MKGQRRPDRGGALRTAISFSGIAVQMGVTIYLGHLLGTWLDAEFQTSFLEETITLFAVFLSLYLVIKKAMAMGK
ncbi:AtpZ/AtpI family protein [Maribacter sp. 2307ULW6-5]|uniref:AtpZ/AtpI family protein n=1 Tax=Maribacter sp. 2307ULW6-5 TaxID=3386275 RepID=UPI0039BD2957